MSSRGCTVGAAAAARPPRSPALAERPPRAAPRGPAAGGAPQTRLVAPAHGGLARRRRRLRYRTGPIVFWAGSLACIADAVTTWLVLRVVPGGHERNLLVAEAIRLLGVGPALCLRVGLGVGWSWLLAGLSEGRHGLALVGSLPHGRRLVTVTVVCSTAALWLVVAHNLALLAA